MGWIVLHVKARCEKRLNDYCKKHGISCYLPLRSETKLFQRRKVTVEKPLFAGYFFCSADEDSRKTVLASSYIVRVLETVCERGLKRDLVRVRRALRVDPTLMACKQLERGKRVRITNGPLMGTEGTVSGVRGTGRVFLDVEMIGQAIAVEVEPSWVELI